MTILRMLAFRPEAAARSLPLPKNRQSAPAAPKAQAMGWPELVRELPVAGAARELARNAELQRREGHNFDLVVPKAKAYLAERAYVDKLKSALEQHLGATVSLKVGVGETAGATAAAIEAGEREARRAAAAQSVQADGFVQDLVNIFDAKVLDSSLRESGK